MARIEISQLEKALAFAREDAHHVEIERNKLRKDS